MGVVNRLGEFLLLRCTCPKLGELNHTDRVMRSPGRFFASNEIKVIVAHLLLMFDWRFAKGDEPKSLSLMDSEFVPDITQKIWVKPRVPEIDIASF